MIFCQHWLHVDLVVLSRRESTPNKNRDTFLYVNGTYEILITETKQFQEISSAILNESCILFKILLKSVP